MQTDGLLEAVDIGGQVGVEIVGVEGPPETGKGGALEVGVEGPQLGDSLSKLRGAGQGGWGEQVEGEVELGGGEGGHGLDEDVGDDLVLDAVGVELVAKLRAVSINVQLAQGWT